MDDSDAPALPNGDWLGLELDAHASDDVATLADALALVGECGLVSLEDLGIGEEVGAAELPIGLSVQPSEDGESSSSSTTPPPTAVKVKKPTGQRQKEELEYLRTTVAQLEHELSSLKKQSESVAVGGTSKAVVTPMACVWEDIATRQSEQRQRAEVENTKLRLLVEEQLRVARSFERLLKKRSVTDFLGSSEAHAFRKRLDAKLDASPESDFHELLANLDVMHTELDDVMASDYVAVTTLPHRDIRVRADELLNTIVEAVDVRVAPFELHDLSDATWHQMAYHKHPGRETVYADRLDMSDDQYTRDFVVTLDTARIKATFRGNIVARRIMEEDRVVLLWTSTMKPTDASSELEGMRQKAYSVLTRVADQAGQALTLTKTFIVFEPIESDDPRHKRAVGALTKFVLGSVTVHMEEARQQIENLLLSRKVGSTSTMAITPS